MRKYELPDYISVRLLLSKHLLKIRPFSVSLFNEKLTYATP